MPGSGDRGRRPERWVTHACGSARARHGWRGSPLAAVLLAVALLAGCASGPSSAPSAATAPAATSTASGPAASGAPGPERPTSPATSPAPAVAVSPAASAVTASPPPAAAALPTVGGPVTTLKVGTLPTTGNAPIIIAQQRGYFKAEGLDVQLLSFSNGGEIVAPLGSGQIDVGISIAPSAGLVNAIQRNVPLKAVASNGTIVENGNIANIVLRKGLPNAGPSFNLATLPKPVRAAVTAPGILPDAVLRLELEKAGFAESDIHMVYLGLPDMNAAFKSGNIDVAASGEPLITIGEQQGVLARWKPMASDFPGLPYSLVVYGTNLLQKDPDLGRRFMIGYLRGTRDYENAFLKGQDKQAIEQMLSGPLKIPVPLFEGMQKAGGLAYIDPNGAVDPKPMAPIIDFWTRTKAIQPGFDASKMVDTSFADAAVKQLGIYNR